MSKNIQLFIRKKYGQTETNRPIRQPKMRHPFEQRGKEADQNRLVSMKDTETQHGFVSIFIKDTQARESLINESK